MQYISSEPTQTDRLNGLLYFQNAISRLIGDVILGVRVDIIGVVLIPWQDGYGAHELRTVGEDEQAGLLHGSVLGGLQLSPHRFPAVLARAGRLVGGGPFDADLRHVVGDADAVRRIVDRRVRWTGLHSGFVPLRAPAPAVLLFEQHDLFRDIAVDLLRSLVRLARPAVNLGDAEQGAPWIGLAVRSRRAIRL